MGLLKHEPRLREPAVGGRFERMFDDWMRTFPLGREWMLEEAIRVDEFQENGTLVVRAELPGIDPDEDVELTVADGMLHIVAERREEEQSEEKGFLRRELRYGKLFRTLPLPDGASESDIAASYKDGILEIRVPAPEPKAATKVPITKS